MAFVDKARKIGFVAGVGLLAMMPGLAVAQSTVPPPAAAASDSAQAAFNTPEAAVSAVSSALAADDTAKLLDIFGHDHAEVVLGPDPASGRVMRARAARLFHQKVTLHHEGPDKIVLIVSNGWPMPVPLVLSSNGWVFDTAAGEEEILARRIGQDELAAIAALHTFVDAERNYAASHSTSGEPARYARYIQSTPGETNGLWWNAATEKKAGPSPLAGFAQANKEFLQGREPGDPFRGYFFRILTAQGPNAPGGERGYLQPDGVMTSGFAIVAWPAVWRESGVMTFLVGLDGKVLQKDLGPDTSSVAAGIQAYNPGPGWEPAESAATSGAGAP